MTRERIVHALAVEESSAGHRPARDCPCGTIAMRDLATGQVRILRHRNPPTVRPLTPVERRARADFEANGWAPWLDRGEAEE